MDKLNLDTKVLLSTLWIFVLINMIYADIIGMLRPGYIELLNQMSQKLSSSTVLIFSVLMEIPILMILLSRILSINLNKIANYIAVPISIVYVIFGGLDNPPVSYMFFATIEIFTMLFIFILSYKWKQPIVNEINYRSENQRSF
jgi:hypothetical protein